jgi:hypothetical protein
MQSIQSTKSQLISDHGPDLAADLQVTVLAALTCFSIDGTTLLGAFAKLPQQQKATVGSVVCSHGRSLMKFDF